MAENIFRVRTELELDEILENNKYKLVSVVYSTNNTTYLPKDIDILLKKLLKRVMAVKHKNSIFVYINLSDFIASSDKYIGNVNKENIPVAHFFWDYTRIGVIEKLGSESFITVVEKLLDEINQKVTSKTTQPSDTSSATKPPDETSPTNQEPQSPQKEPVVATTQPEQIVTVDPPKPQELPAAVVSNPLNVPAELLGSIDQKTIDEQLLYQKKMEEIEKLRTIYEINELKKIKKLKENEENKS